MAFEVLTRNPSQRLRLIQPNIHCREIWSKHALTILKTHRQSPHAAQAENWAVEIDAENYGPMELQMRLVRKKFDGIEPSQHAVNSMRTMRRAG